LRLAGQEPATRQSAVTVQSKKLGGSTQALGLTLSPDPKPSKNPVNIEAVGRKPGVVAVVPGSGWPLAVRLKGNNELGIGTPQAYPADFPFFGLKGFLVLSDEDGCYSWMFAAFQRTLSDPPCTPLYPFDEKWVEFTPDIDMPGQTDLHIPPGLADFNLGPLLGHQEINLGVGTSHPSAVTLMGRMGAAVGDDSTNDGYGFGHDDDLPGLVVLADRGLGIKYDDEFVRHSPLTARNLAGLGQSVAYILNDSTPTATQDGRVVIEWHMNVPRALMGPFKLIDQCTGNVTFDETSDPGHLFPICDGAESKVDGAAPPTEFLTDLVTTLRIFVVNVNKTQDYDQNGPLPLSPPYPIDELADLNSDGIVGAKDAQLAGYTVLSDEQVVEVRILQPLPYNFGDIDGNGYSLLHDQIPSGAGGLTRRPQ
jgi:hypothetical protein